MEVYRLYDNKTGIAIGLTAGYDICDPKDRDCVVKVIGRRAYASTLEEAQRSIRAEYIERMEEAGTLSREYREFRDYVRGMSA